MLEATYRVGEDDVAAFGAYQAVHSRAYRRSRLSTTLLPAAAVSFLALTLALEQGSTARSLAVFLFITSVGGLVGWYLWRTYPRYMARRVSRIYAGEPAPSLLGDYALSIGENGMVVSNEHERSELAWSSIVGVAETRDHIFAFVGPLQAIVVPKASLLGASPPTLLDAIRRHVRAAP